MFMFRQCPYESLREVAEQMRLQAKALREAAQKYDAEAGYITRWCDTLQPDGRNDSADDDDGDSSLSLERIPRPDVALDSDT